jgi:hypothetical protein
MSVILDGGWKTMTPEELHEAGATSADLRPSRLVRRMLAQNGNPDLVVETDGYTTVTVRKTG